MKVIIRKSNINDLNKIYDLHNLCFSFNDRWYKNAITQYIDDSIVIETEDNNIIGILLQGYFIPVIGNEEMIDNINSFKEKVFGILMLCIHPDYRNNGLATKLINNHKKLNIDKELYLCTRITNNNAISLYLKNKYKYIGTIKNKYYLPQENGYFMCFN